MDIIPTIVDMENKGRKLLNFCKLYHVIIPEKELVNTRNNLDAMISEADYYCF